MKLTKLEELYNCLKNETNEIIMDPEVAQKAKNCLDNMLKLS